MYHSKGSIQVGDIRHSQDEDTDKSGRSDDRERGSRLDERNLTRSKKMDDEELIVETISVGILCLTGNRTCVRAPSRNQAV